MIQEARRIRRRYENKWRTKGRLEIDKQIFLEQKAEVDRLIDQAKSDYYKNQLFSADSKKQFNVLNTLLNYSSKILPTTDSWSDLANHFASFFIEKVRDNLDSNQAPAMGIATRLGVESLKSSLESSRHVRLKLYYTF